MTTNPLAQYAAGISGPLLGYIVFYTVTGEQVRHAETLTKLQNDPTFDKIGGQFPTSAPSDLDVFKRTASSIKRTKIPTPSDGVTKNVLVRSMGSMNNTTTRRVVVEHVDGDKKVLSFEQHADVEFNHVSGVANTRKISHVLSGTALDDDAWDVALEIVQEFNSWRGCLNSNAIREWLRAELKGIHAISIKRGVYFVAAKHSDVLDQLTRFTSLLPGSSAFHTVPLPDNAKQRAMLEGVFESEAAEEIDDLMSEVQTIVSKKSRVTKPGRQARIDSANQLRDKLAEYQGTLNSSLRRASARMHLLDAVMNDFISMDSPPVEARLSKLTATLSTI